MEYFLLLTGLTCLIFFIAFIVAIISKKNNEAGIFLILAYVFAFLMTIGAIVS